MYFEEHKSQREISRIEGRSLRDVNKIIKAHRNKSEIKELPGDSNIGRNDNRAPKAYALYEKQYSPVQVAIRLKLDANEAMQYF